MVLASGCLKNKADKSSIESSNIRKYFDDSEVSIIHSNYIKFIKEYLL